MIASVDKSSASTLLGRRVLDGQGRSLGRIIELAVDTSQDTGRITSLILRRGLGKEQVAIPVQGVTIPQHAGEALRTTARPEPVGAMENTVLIERDLLDQQIIDVDGRKVVRVNDVNFTWVPRADGLHAEALHLDDVEVGVRGAARRLLHGLPQRAILGLSERLSGNTIPWSCVDLIERDPNRRVRLKIGQERLARMHPSDIADILEDLAPAEREAVFSSLPEETAAETLEEIEPRLQKELMQGLGYEKAADILEEMDPGAAADVLGELTDEQSEAILEEMDPEERQDVEELLEFSADSAAGRMTTDFFYVEADATVAAAIAALRAFEGDPDWINEVYLLGARDELAGVVRMARLLLAAPETAMRSLVSNDRPVTCQMDADEEDVAELFDKYNLLSLPVLDHADRVAGVIYAEQVIAGLRGD